MARILSISAPLGLLLLWFASQRLRGRPIRRSDITTALSLVLLAYFLVVVGTGIFWVAAQELPIFDWHYLAGYFLLLLTVAHVALHWRSLSVFFRRQLRPAGEGAGVQLTLSGRLATRILAVGMVGTLVFLAGVRYGARTLQITLQDGERPFTPTALELVGKPLVPPILVKSSGAGMTVAQFYHDGSSYPARARLPGLTLSARPDVYKRYEGKARVPFGAVVPEGGGRISDALALWEGGPGSDVAGKLTIGQLGMLLFAAQGITGQVSSRSRNLVIDLRSAPSAGALYPVNVYVLVQQVEGIAPGLYYFHPEERALVQVSLAPNLVMNLALASGSGDLVGNAPATVIFTATFGRTAFKYEERAYRYVANDTGHAAYNLGLAAGSMALWAPAIARFDDQVVNSSLEVEPGEEAAMLIMPIGAPDKAAAEPRFEHERTAVDAFGEATFVSLIHFGTALRRTGGGGELPRHPGHSGQGGTGTVLPAPAEGAPLFHAIRTRRSVRDHTGVPINQQELSALLSAAIGTTAQRNPFLVSSAPLNLYAVVRDVKGLAPGVYRYEPASRALIAARRGDFSQAMVSACLDQEFCGSADVVFVKTQKWRDLLFPDGDRGYRYAFLRGAMASEGLYVQGAALGIGACAVGAFLDADVADVLGIDFSREIPLLVTAVGR
ncbi:MAG: SagB/ThcOx family dehydrogenase [Candidatus Schekmanbacteria bacterium]|nr:SagB/ThcOx family dehydrogenase [Candidatus Schekmanbacteria bacterium]